MFRFIIGFVLGIYVSLYGVNAVVSKIVTIYDDIKGEIVEEQKKSDPEPDISI